MDTNCSFRVCCPPKSAVANWLGPIHSFRGAFQNCGRVESGFTFSSPHKLLHHRASQEWPLTQLIYLNSLRSCRGQGYLPYNRGGGAPPFLFREAAQQTSTWQCMISRTTKTCTQRESAPLCQSTFGCGTDPRHPPYVSYIAPNEDSQLYVNSWRVHGHGTHKSDMMMALNRFSNRGQSALDPTVAGRPCPRSSAERCLWGIANFWGTPAF